LARQPEVKLPAELFRDLERSGPVPLYYQISNRLEDAITSGQLPAGTRLENEIALSERLGLSRPTVRRAIQELVDKGLLVRRRGIGTQVVHGQVSRKVELTSLNEDLRESGRRPATTVLVHEVVPADDAVARALVVQPGSPTLHIRRLRTADGTPLAILDNHLPEAYTDLDREDLQERGLYELLRERGVVFSVAKQVIGARHCTAKEAELLDVPKTSAALTMSRTAFDNNGMAIELGEHCYRPDLYSFEIMLVSR
jgi:DNA-binding GntR family transcriptional regulator